MATTALIVLLHLGPWELTLELGPPERCRATVFAYPGDRYVGGVAPALGRVPRGTDWAGGGPPRRVARLREPPPAGRRQHRPAGPGQPPGRAGGGSSAAAAAAPDA